MAKRQQSRVAAGTPGLVRLVDAGITHAIRSYEYDEAASGSVGYGLEASTALGMKPERVFKTLVVVAGRSHVLGIVPVSCQLDLKAMAQALGQKQVTLVAPDVAERVSGSVVGGISPLGGRTPLDVILDDSASAYATILVSAGKRGVDVELAPGDLLAVTGGRTAPISRSARRG